MSAPKTLDEAAVTAWLADAVGATAPVQFDPVGGGRSNLTFRATDAAGGRWALRRPPLGDLLPTAHDMAREFRVLKALATTPVPVPAPHAFCEDPTVTGAPFYVMEFVDGAVLPEPLPDGLAPSFVQAAAESFVDALADLHAVDPDAVGLGGLSKRDGYVARQLRRWHEQFHRSTSRALPLVDEVHDRLAAAIPPQTVTAVVHNDYRLENCVLRPDGGVAAILDWEICTLGDPRADLAYVVTGWPGPPRDFDVLIERYARRRGAHVEDLPYFIAFSHWRTACILEGVHARYAAGGGGSDQRDYRHYLDRVVDELERARDVLAVLR